MMEGIGCHAGVFSNAYDLAELGEAWLRGGTLKGVELVSSDVLATWTDRGFPEGENRRGCVFDKPALEPDSGPTCDLSSWTSFGHTGFTGTLLWVDPLYDLVYVFLSNRTTPDQSNTKLLKLDTRTEIQRVVLEHLGAASHVCTMTSLDSVLKIGIVCYPTFGGSGVVATELGKALAHEGHEVHFITYNQPVRLGSFHPGVFYHEWKCRKYPLFDYPLTNWC